MANLLSVDEALARILGAANPLEPEDVDLAAALGRVVVSPVRADVDDPPFDRSAMDGLAVRAADVAEPVTLRLIGVIAAGDPPPERPVMAGEAYRIMTGAPLPPGADAVVIVEHTEDAGGGAVRVLEGAPRGANIRVRGEVAKRGDEVVSLGRLVTPEVMGVLASFGVGRVAVVRRPRVVVMATGNELVPVEAVPGPGQIRDSNRWTIAALAELAGAVVDVAPTVRDDRASVLAAIRAGLQHDVLVLSGGVSMGTFDIVGECLRALGAEVLLHKVAIQPGKPLLVARCGRTLIFGLPGNPVSVLVTGRVFLMPALRRMAGRQRPSDPLIPARLAGTLPVAAGRTIYHPAVILFTDGAPMVTPLQTLGSADQVGHARRNCFIVRQQGAGPHSYGESVPCMIDPLGLLDWGD